MTTQELEALILELIKDIYNAEYIGKLKVTKAGNGYLIQLGMDVPEYPISIYAELEGDKLIKFLKEELHNRHLSSAYFSSIQLVYKALCQPVNTKCCDQG